MTKSTPSDSLGVIERAIQAGMSDSGNRPTRPTDETDPTMPNYVEHREGVTEIGKLSAEAVVREYEATAKEIESMGIDLVERVKACEAMTRDTLQVTQELNEIAARYRKEAKRVFEHIENCSLLVAAARETCGELKDKLAIPTRLGRLGTDRSDDNNDLQSRD
ncbi:MAG: hypothetical protein KGK16_11985 [Bradyrhizobium sp.]|nr:hypothetical protein [Bradyrhizobium sp.]